MVLRRKVKWFIIAVLAPELVIAMALQQRLEARRTFAKLAGLPSMEKEDLDVNPTTFANSRQKDRERNKINKIGSNVQWTLAHGFLITMGGLIARTQDDNGSHIKYTVLRVFDVEKLARRSDAVFPDLDARDIKDRSKSDSFAKLFAVAQSTWLLVNVLGRAGHHLPVTPIEIVTLGYVVCALIIYALWWSKPKDVMVPLVIRLQAEKRVENYAARGRMRRKNLDDDDDDYENILVSVIGAVIATLYGAVHVVAWDFEFASAGERVAWRVCSVAAMIAPGLAGIIGPSLLWLYDKSPSWVSLLCMGVYRVTTGTLILAYVVSRVALMVLSCMAMRSLPSACYDSVNWVAALPHF